jgi:hypothetical protein
MLTLPHEAFVPFLPPGIEWIKGQLELGEGGFLHWQVIVGTAKKVSQRAITNIFGPYHCELTRSEHAEVYVWKEDSRVAGTQFELGSRPFNRSIKRDWDQIWECAKIGDIMGIPASVRIQCYRTVKQIGVDYVQPVAIERTTNVFWGSTGTGKSRRAWEEAGLAAYPKDPRTKFWCGYAGQEHVVIDEFRGGIDIAHILRWLDRYPVVVEVKGGSSVLKATTIWITSNLDPRIWFPDLDAQTTDALLRRMNITHFDSL